MNSGDLKTYKYVKITKSNFFTITILSLHSIYSESKKRMVSILQFQILVSSQASQKFKSKLPKKSFMKCTYVILHFLVDLKFTVLEKLTKYPRKVFAPSSYFKQKI